MGCLSFHWEISACPSRGPWPATQSALQAGGFFWALTVVLPQILEIIPFHEDDQVQECQALVNKVPSLIKKEPALKLSRYAGDYI